MRLKLLYFYFFAALVGLSTGFVGSLFQSLIAYGHAYYLKMLHPENAHPLWGLALAMGGSVVIILIATTLVNRVAPEAIGSGVQEIEGVLLSHNRPRWKRVLPVKFFGGLLSNISFLVVGREGPSIHMGGCIGAMVGELLHLHRSKVEILITAGAAAGLTTAFNAPLAGVLFVIEEMRNVFRYSFTNYTVVAVACLVASAVTTQWIGDGPALVLPDYAKPPMDTLGIFALFGVVVGFLGVIFNRFLMLSLAITARLSPQQKTIYVVLVAMLVGGLGFSFASVVGGGYDVILKSISMPPSIGVLLLVAGMRFMLMLLSYNTGVPGGIFAPMLALGTLVGLAFAKLMLYFFPTLDLELGMFAVAGMGGLFAASVQAPLTGMVLVVEMTNNYNLILPMMATCLSAMAVGQLLGNQAIYTQLMKQGRRAHLQIQS